MTEGEYELLLSEDLTIPNGDLPNKRNGSWENVSTNYDKMGVILRFYAPPR